MKSYLVNFLQEFDYPADSRKVLCDAYDAVMANEEASALFSEAMALYDESLDFDPAKTLSLADDAAKLTGIHGYTLELLVFICMSKRLEERYREKGIDRQIFFDSMCDLKYKLVECKRVKGIDGSFVAFWFPGFFKMTRFAIGRMQYEIVNFRKNSYYEKNGVTLTPENKVINVHIPSSGEPLTPEVCDASFRAAADFFRPSLGGAKVAFVCASWMLYSKTRHLFSEKSNTAKFIARFDIVSEKEDPEGKFPDMWRIFHMDYTGNAADYPTDTSMQRAFRDYILGGGRTGSGYGIILYEA